MNRIEEGIDQERAATRAACGDSAVQRIQITVRCGNQYGNRGNLFDYANGGLMQTQQIICAGSSATQEIIGFQGIDANGKTLFLQSSNHLFEVRERGIRQAPDVDDVRAIPSIVLRLANNAIHAEFWRISNLGENADIVVGQVADPGFPSEEFGEITKLIGTAFERDTETFRQGRKITATTPRNQHPARAKRILEPSSNHVGRHECGNAESELVNRVGEIRLNFFQDLPELTLCELSSQEVRCVQAFTVKP